MENQSLVKEICPTTTQDWVRNGAVLIDVREVDEVNELAYDVPEIINIPLSEFEDRFHEVPKDRDVVVVCRSGGRSLRAAGFLINHGYNREKVVNMQHGMIRWAQKGFPTKGNTTTVLTNVPGSGCCETATPSSETQSSCDSSLSSKDSKCC